jgi:hypothetical protein
MSSPSMIENLWCGVHLWALILLPMFFSLWFWLRRLNKKQPSKFLRVIRFCLGFVTSVLLLWNGLLLPTHLVALAYSGPCTITVIDAKTQKPIPNVQVRLSWSRSGPPVSMGIWELFISNHQSNTGWQATDTNGQISIGWQGWRVWQCSGTSPAIMLGMERTFVKSLTISANPHLAWRNNLIIPINELDFANWHQRRIDDEKIHGESTIP